MNKLLAAGTGIFLIVGTVAAAHAETATGEIICPASPRETP